VRIWKMDIGFMIMEWVPDVAWLRLFRASVRASSVQRIFRTARHSAVEVHRLPPHPEMLTDSRRPRRRFRLGDADTEDGGFIVREDDPDGDGTGGIEAASGGHDFGKGVEKGECLDLLTTEVIALA